MFCIGELGVIWGRHEINKVFLQCIGIYLSDKIDFFNLSREKIGNWEKIEIGEKLTNGSWKKIDL